MLESGADFAKNSESFPVLMSAAVASVGPPTLVTWISVLESLRTFFAETLSSPPAKPALYIASTVPFSSLALDFAVSVKTSIRP